MIFLYQAGLRVIIRDWCGETIGALSTSVPTAQTIVELEALACRQAMLFAVELGLQDVVFEGDSLQVIQTLSGWHKSLDLWPHSQGYPNSSCCSFFF